VRVVAALEFVSSATQRISRRTQHIRRSLSAAGSITLSVTMALRFHPRAGTVLICDFRGAVAPEIRKRRPVVVISPRHVTRSWLVTVVPLSSVPPNPVREYHHRLGRVPYLGACQESWVKCDLVVSVSFDRLSRIRASAGHYIVVRVPDEDLRRIRIAAARSFGIDGSEFRA
jgi:mRNA interferase MazF